jgi:hypothetical protein
MRMNKRGSEAGDMTLVFLFGVILFMIIGGIALGMGIFYGQPIDYRSADASLLYTSVARCISSHTPDNKFFDSIYSNCHLVESTIKNKNMVLAVASGAKIYVQQGDPVQCQLQNKNEDYPRCVSGDVSVLINGQPVVFHIITGSNQEARLV